MAQENRYSRLKALEEYGYDVDWTILHDKTIVIAGVGGVGSIVSELLCRVGVKKLHLIDLDTVEIVNLNRMIFTEENIGQAKVTVMQEKLRLVNPEVEVEAHKADICAMMFEDTLQEMLEEADLGMMCLDNIPARQYFNVKCIRHNLPYIDMGLFRSGLGGYVHLVIPQETACYQCIGAVDVTNTNDARGLPCAASLPTTVNIMASVQVQQSLKYFLNFGRIPSYTTYNALSGVMEEVLVKVDPDCYVCGKEGIAT